MEPKVLRELRRAIAECGGRQIDLARRAGVDKAVLCRFLSRERGITVDGAEKLARALGYDLVLRKRKGQRHGKSES